MDIRIYLEAAGIDLRLAKKDRKRVHLKRGIPYTPQEFPPEETRSFFGR